MVPQGITSEFNLHLHSTLSTLVAAVPLILIKSQSSVSHWWYMPASTRDGVKLPPFTPILGKMKANRLEDEGKQVREKASTREHCVTTTQRTDS